MRITILTIGTRGDVQPYLALGAGLQRAGHQVTVAAHDTFASWIESVDLEVQPMSGNPAEIMQDAAARTWLESGDNPAVFVRRMMDVAKPMMWNVLADYERACAGAELIVFPVLATLVAASLGERNGARLCPAYLQPVHPSRYYGFSLLQPRPKWGALYNRASHAVSEALFWQATRPVVNRWRQAQLGLSPYPLRSPFMRLLRRLPLCLYGLSRHVVPPAPDWPTAAQLTGYWFLDTPADWRPDDVLCDFLDGGPPPVYVGFGSMTNRNPAEITEIALAALRRSGQRGLLMTGWGGLSRGAIDDDVFVIDSAPHDWLFPRMAAVVHHGGCGTTAAGLRAGVPSVVVPFFADQPFWAARVEQLGVGPAPVPRRSLTAERMACAIRAATGDPAIQRRAAQLGRRIAAEDGVAGATKAINRLKEFY